MSSGHLSELRGLVFTVAGAPVSQGSHKAFVVGGKARITDAKPGLKPWRKKIADAALEARGEQPLFDGPVQVRARFVMERPKSHYGTGRNSGVLKNSAPHYVTSHQKGDLDKHMRSIYDALTGVAFGDDSQVAVSSESKVWGASNFVLIDVQSLDRGIVTSTDKEDCAD